MSVSTGDNSLEPDQLLNQLAIARKEIHNLRQQLISLNHIHKKECDSIHQKLNEWKCSSCRANQTYLELSEPSTAFPSHDFQTKYIGRISTHFPEKRGTPRQPGICNDMIAKLTLDSNLFTNPGHALDGLQEFSHMWILFHFHRNESTHMKAKVSPPRLNGIRTGVFATRSPHRPCPIGLSLVKIDRIMENTIYFSGVDMVNDTPVLDIKPYIPHYDSPGYVNADNNSCVIDDFPESPDISRDVSLSEASTSDNIDGRPPSISNIHLRTEESFHTRSNSRIGEREAPDGEEEESPRIPQVSAALPSATTPDGQIRVPPWIDQPATPRLTVLFKDRAIAQLNQLGSEGEEKKTAITNVLREDPRSVYLRERWGSHCYVFRIAELYVSCKFNDGSRSVTVYQVFQNETSAEGEE
ncbi:hypothetical protein JTB14_037918 [Gonioctena quinquepunctata]|nr:hypothetical protein JTB14_037918 [Gonioctena quinquepunctata]